MDPGSTAAALPEPPGLVEPDAVDDPYRYLAAALRRAPVHREWPLPQAVVPEGENPSVSVLGYDEVLHVLRDHETYSSRGLTAVMGPMFAGTIIAMDEPEHRASRTLVAPAFRPKLLGRWEETLIRRVIDDIIDTVASRGRAELVRELTFAFPVQVIARILGLPESDVPQFQRWSIDLLTIFLDAERGMTALGELHDYLVRQLEERRAEPRDDLMSELVTSEVDGHRLDDDAIVAFLRLLLPAGVETTYRSLGNLLFALLTHPDQLDDVRRNPAVRAAAIEEGLRWETPFLMVARDTTRATRLAGVEIPADRPVMVFVGAGNRDPGRFEHPDRFDVHRPPVPHLTFGSGVHVCLGMHLARLESRVALDAILERLPNLRLDPAAPSPRIQGNVFRSPSALPVLFDGPPAFGAG